MTENINAEVAAVEPQALKSTDTSTKAETVETTHTPKAEKVETKVEATVKPPEGESTTDAPEADLPAESKKDSRKVKERLERLRRETIAETREQVAREYEQRIAALQVAQKPAASAAKTLEDFDFDQSKYTDYLVDLKLETRDQQKRQATEQEKFQAKKDALEAKYGEDAWDEIIESPVNRDAAFKPLTDLFHGDEHDLEIAHYLAENLDEAKRINALPKLQQVREIAKLAEQFTEGEKPAAVVKKTTSAPPPVKTITGAGKPSVDISSPEMSTADRIAAWKKQGRR